MKKFLLLLLCVPMLASTYFVANSGQDENAGTVPDSPWRSLARVNAASFLPDDVILLKRGDVWREQLVPPSSGSSGHQITISAYGTGVNPTVSGADPVSQWTRVAGSSTLWCSSVATQPRVVFIGGMLGVPVSAQSLLNAPGNWNWATGTLCVYAPAGPPEKVEAAQRDYALLLGQTGTGSYVTVRGINFEIANLNTIHIVNTSFDTISDAAITGAYQFGILAIGADGGTVDHLLLNNNAVSLNGSSGIEISSGHLSVRVIRSNVFANAYNAQNTENFQFTAGIYLYSSNQATATDDLVENNSSHDNGVLGGTESQGVGIWMDTLRGSIMRFNIAYNNASHGIYLEKNINSSMIGNFSYSNGAAQNSANITCYASFSVPANGNVVINNITWNSHGIGLKLGAYQGGGPTQFDNNTVEDNVVINSGGVNVSFDSGANNDTVHGTGNVYRSNSFGQESPDWIYWVGVGSISTYAELDAAYGSPMNNHETVLQQ